MNAPSKELAANKKAYFDYEILETYEAGIALVGTEVKSLKDHGGNLQEGYVKVIDDELWLLNSSIALYKYGNIHNHEEKRDRKLLMHKKEIEKIRKVTTEKGLTLVALSFYLKNRKVKVKIGLARGKKNYDKRKSIQEKDEKRKIDRAMKSSSYS